jgi:hypothetical protein
VPYWRIYKYISFVLFFLPELLIAQDLEFEDAYEPDSVYAVRNAIKIDPVQIVVGEYELIYERILSNHWSVEAGLGITRRNYLADRRGDYTLDDLGQNVSIETGYSFTLSFRNYFRDSPELIGPYMELGGNIRQYDLTYSVIDTSGALTGDSFPDTRKFTSGFLNIGFQALPQNSNIFADFYVGVALRYADLSIIRAEDIHDPETYFYEETEEWRWGFNIGVKIGVGF